MADQPDPAERFAGSGDITWDEEPPPPPAKTLTLHRDGTPVRTHLPFATGGPLTNGGHPAAPGDRTLRWRRSGIARTEEGRVATTFADPAPADSPDADPEDTTEAEHTTVMVALYPVDPGPLVVEGGDAAEDLHVTIAFLGESAGIDPDALEGARSATAVTAGDFVPFDAFVAGYGTLGSEGAVVLVLEAQELNDLCADFWSQVNPDAYVEQHDGFIPHLTLGYGIDLAAAEPFLGTTITLGTLALVDQGETDPYPLGDAVAPTETPTPPSPTAAARRKPRSVYVDGSAAASGTEQVYVDAGAPATGTEATMAVAVGEGPDPVVVEDPSAPADQMAFVGLLVVEGVESGDERIINEGALSWRELPLPLMAMFANPESGGHAGAAIAGRIDNIWRNEERPNELWGSGIYDDSDTGREAYRMLQAGMLKGVSVDLDNVSVEFESTGEPSDDPLEALFGDPGRMVVTSARLMGATQTSFPAFAEAYLEVPEVEDEVIALAASGGDLYRPELRAHSLLDSQGALVASGGLAYPETPPAAWFEAPDLDGPTPVRVDLDGRVRGHVAAWSSCHIGFGEGHCVEVPRSRTAYASFRTGQTLTAEGTLVATGPLVTDTVHPSLKLQASDAATFYAHSGAVVADVSVGEDAHGVWVAGSVRPGATAEQVRALRGGDVSPDWRSIRGALEVVAMLVVNCSGFKVSEALAASAGEAIVPGEGARGRIELGSGKVLALVAAGALPRRHADDNARRIDTLAAQLAELQAQVAPLRAARARQLAARFKSAE